MEGAGLILAILLDVALFMVLYLMLPHAASGWREILPGAIAAGLLWELAKRAFLYFISTYISISNLVYGSVAAIVRDPDLGLPEQYYLAFWRLLRGLHYYERRQQRRKAAGQSHGRSCHTSRLNGR